MTSDFPLFSVCLLSQEYLETQMQAVLLQLLEVHCILGSVTSSTRSLTHAHIFYRWWLFEMLTNIRRTRPVTWLETYPDQRNLLIKRLYWVIRLPMTSWMSSSSTQSRCWLAYRQVKQRSQCNWFTRLNPR